MSEELKLPPLPEPDGVGIDCETDDGSYWYAPAMREYARQAVLAERERANQHGHGSEHGHVTDAIGVAPSDPVPSLELAVKLPLHHAAQWNNAVICAQHEPHKLVVIEGRTVLAVHSALAHGVSAVDSKHGVAAAIRAGAEGERG